MSGGGLILKLAPKERVLINSAVIENGDRSARLCIRTPGANILRLADALHPGEATTPVTRTVFLCQLILSGDLGPEEGRRQLLRALEELTQVFADHDSGILLDRATAGVLAGNEYAALKALRSLIPREARLMGLLQ